MKQKIQRSLELLLSGHVLTPRRHAASCSRYSIVLFGHACTSQQPQEHGRHFASLPGAMLLAHQSNALRRRIQRARVSRRQARSRVTIG